MMKRITLVLIIQCTLTIHGIAQQGAWTWMNGDSTANSLGVYGTQGVFAPTNTPPALYEACEWTDKQGNFWLFGGQGQNINLKYGDLWEYKPSINQWAWMKGPGITNQAGVYGTISVPNIANYPGCRNFGEPSWVDTAGNLWMFGGYGYDVNGTDNELSDLWMYNIASNEWTWMKGPDVGGDPGSYGAFQVESSTNNPPCRCEFSTGWIDSHNNLWLFGGVPPADTAYSDMWRFNIATNNWTWMKGPNTLGNPAVYGTKGVEDSANVPGARWSYGHWIDSANNLYFFGGTNGLQFSAEVYNDMWRYNTTTNNWTWISGTNLNDDSGHYGPQCLADTAFCPPARFENRVCWKRGSDNFILYGGSGPGFNLSEPNDSTYNDVWNYNVVSRAWSWISGSNHDQQTSVHGTLGVPNFANHPSARDGSSSWTDLQGNLWLFGGFQADGQMYNETGSMYNDLWRWTPDTIPPIPNFTSHPDSGCMPLTVVFTNTSVNSTSYHWYFGDGHDTTVANPTHIYTSPGIYTVKLIASNNSPCASGVDSITKDSLITVIAAPTGTFTGDTLNGCDSLTVHFTNQTTGASSYSWSFGDGGTSVAINPTHTYHSTGTFTVTLIAYGQYCNDTIIRPQYIQIDTPQTVHSAFIADTFSGCKPLTVSFTNNSINGTSFFWNFGDDSTSTSMNPTHTYDTTGTFTVKLISINTSFCGIVKDSLIQTAYITVYPYAVASFTQIPDTGCAPMNVQFTNTSTHATSYIWRFGDNQISTGTSPSHTYSNHGTYTVTLVAIGADGCNDSTTFSSIIVDTLPTVTSAFVADTLSGCNPFTVHFTNNSVNGTTYLWNFGDNTTNDSLNPTHTYIDSGTYTVTLRTFSTNECGTVEDSSIHQSYISVEEPVSVKANFDGKPLIGCAPLNVTFTNSSVNASHYFWNFGDGFTDTTMNPTHTFFNPSNKYYTVTLVVTHPGQKCDNLPDTMTIQVEADTCMLYVPNVFSPNGDGKNDVFELIADGFQGYHLVIFDRWGLKMFESFDHNDLWNGLVNNTGGEAPDGTYYYIFYSTDYNGQPYSNHGFRTLIR
jgi:gliding motility-associated-like protein